MEYLKYFSCIPRSIGHRTSGAAGNGHTLLQQHSSPQFANRRNTGLQNRKEGMHDEGSGECRHGSRRKEKGNLLNEGTQNFSLREQRFCLVIFFRRKDKTSCAPGRVRRQG